MLWKFLMFARDVGVSRRFADRRTATIDIWPRANGSRVISN